MQLDSAALRCVSMKLSDLSPEDRAVLAQKLGSDPGYLWQLATQWRGKKPSLGFMQRMVAADDRLTIADLAEEFAPKPAKRRAAAKAA